MANRVHNPPNRYDPTTVEWDEEPPVAHLRLIEERSRSALVHNDSPDVPFSWSLNPYRGCTHACAYCYARAFHEHLGLGAGSDFERVLHVKPDLPALLEAELFAPSWRGERVALSGITDCYQPIERRLGLTRACLEVLARFRNPVAIITRSPLVLRDLDLLAPLAARGALTVAVSLPIPDPALCRKVEPGAPPPAARLEAMRGLAQAGVPVGVSVSPVIPGLTDHLIPQALEQAYAAGARFAWMQPVRLSGPVGQVFAERLREALPLRADRVLGAIARARDGHPGEARFGHRMRGSGPAWDVVEQVFALHCRRLGYGPPPPLPQPSPFRRPERHGQLGLFGEGG